MNRKAIAKEIRPSELLTDFREILLLFGVLNEKRNKDFQIAYVIYALMRYGAKGDISFITGINERFVQTIIERLRKAEIIDDDYYYFEELEDPVGVSIEISLHLLCADGKIERVPSKPKEQKGPPVEERNDERS